MDLSLKKSTDMREYSVDFFCALDFQLNLMTLTVWRTASGAFALTQYTFRNHIVIA